MIILRLNSWLIWTLNCLKCHKLKDHTTIALTLTDMLIYMERNITESRPVSFTTSLCIMLALFWCWRPERFWWSSGLPTVTEYSDPHELTGLAMDEDGEKVSMCIPGSPRMPQDDVSVRRDLPNASHPCKACILRTTHKHVTLKSTSLTPTMVEFIHLPFLCCGTFFCRTSRQRCHWLNTHLFNHSFLKSPLVPAQWLQHFRHYNHTFYLLTYNKQCIRTIPASSQN